MKDEIVSIIAPIFFASARRSLSERRSVQLYVTEANESYNEVIVKKIKQEAVWGYMVK